MLVETTDYPVQNLTFPAVTVCKEDHEPFSKEFFFKMFDYIEFPCFG